MQKPQSVLPIFVMALLVGVVLTVVGVFIKKPEATQDLQTDTKPKPTTPPSVAEEPSINPSDVVVLVWKEDRKKEPSKRSNVPVATDGFRYDDMVVRLQAKDDIGFDKLTKAGKVIFVEPMTKGRVIQVHLGEIRLRLLSGEHTGKEVYAHPSCVHRDS